MWDLKSLFLVTPTGFEPVNAALRGLRLKPLVDGASRYILYYFTNLYNIYCYKMVVYVKILDVHKHY